VLREYAAVVSAANAAGLSIVAGTDMAVGVIHPGFSLHEELEAEALRAGTINAARLFPRQNTGVVAGGATADLVLLDANPLDDIRNTQRIRAVFLRGRHVDRAALDALLEESAALARVN
jgi:imidazolonepropionase-like amidohydrolase